MSLRLAKVQQAGKLISRRNLGHGNSCVSYSYSRIREDVLYLESQAGN